MAFMIPASLKNQLDTTAGERKLFDLFRTVLPDTCVVRYEVLLGERHYRPDYTLVDVNRGVLVVEIKDWGVDTISFAGKEKFYVRYGHSSPIPQINPSMKCEVYLRHIREAFIAMPSLCGEDGNLKVPLKYFVAFPNITRSDFDEQGFGKVMSPKYVLLGDDLGRNGKGFLARYDEALPILDKPLTSQQEGALQKALFPNNSFALGTHDGFIRRDTGRVVADLPLEPIHLSLEQEQIAKSLGDGPRLLRGIAGTGKTLIMLYRAKLLASNDKALKILVLCWNTSLANYMKQAYARLQFEAQGDVVIQHFSEFAHDLLRRHGERVYKFDDPRFDETLQALNIREYEKYDVICVDEAQDFRKAWIAFIYHNLLLGEPSSRNLLIAADDAQRVYAKRDFSWASLDIPMVGRSKILKTVYRNAARVWVFSAFLLREKAAYLQENPERVIFSTKGGYDPQLIACESLAAQIEKAIEIIGAMFQSGYAARNVLILYRHKNVRGFQLVDYLMARLRQENIPHDWIAEDAYAKRTFEWEAESIKISTVHSAKGMDSPVVIILGAETFDPDFPGNDYDEKKLMYVALTRAREFLVVLYTGSGGLVPHLRECQDAYLKYRDVIIGLEGDGPRAV